MSIQPQQRAEPPPETMLEVYMKMLSGDTGDSFLDEINLGTGNYNTPEYWLQVQSFRNGLFASDGIVRPLMERARYETKRAIVDAIYGRPDSRELDGVDYPPVRDLDREKYFDAHADAIWQNLGSEEYTTYQHQAYLVRRYTDIEQNWVPPHWRMLKMRHEASQSKGARALDNLFKRVQEYAGLNDQNPEDEL